MYLGNNFFIIWGAKKIVRYSLSWATQSKALKPSQEIDFSVSPLLPVYLPRMSWL